MTTHGTFVCSLQASLSIHFQVSSARLCPVLDPLYRPRRPVRCLSPHQAGARGAREDADDDDEHGHHQRGPEHGRGPGGDPAGRRQTVSQDGRQGGRPLHGVAQVRDAPKTASEAPAALPTTTVCVRPRRSSGKVFDCSRERGHAFTFQVGVGRVIKGWDDGVSKLSLGQRAKLTRTSRGLRTVRTGHVHQPPACCTCQRRRAAPVGHCCTHAVHAYQPRACRTYRVPWHYYRQRVKLLVPWVDAYGEKGQPPRIPPRWREGS